MTQAPGTQIVVGIDGSAAAETAVRWAVREARLLVDEPPARALLERAADAEMLVLGTSRPPVQPGQPPLAMGPVARVCLRRAPCPVVMVASGDLPGDEDTRPAAGSLAMPVSVSSRA
jgi:nucleotide-binding universal stress UspA family protein